MRASWRRVSTQLLARRVPRVLERLPQRIYDTAIELYGQGSVSGWTSHQDAVQRAKNERRAALEAFLADMDAEDARLRYKRRRG